MGIKPLLEEYASQSININLENVMLNRIHPNIAHVTNFICLVIKQYLYRKKCENAMLRLFELKNKITLLKNTEKFIAIKNNNMGKHTLKWQC